VCPNEDFGSLGIAYDHVTCTVHLDAVAANFNIREQPNDTPSYGVVFGRPGGTWDADPFDDLPQIILGDGGENAPDRLGHRL
jgi:hypothetical protein